MKVIINRDVQFVENESWNGTVEKNVKIVSNVEYDEMTKEVIQIPLVSQSVTKSSTATTPQYSSAHGTSSQLAAKAMQTSTTRGK